VAFDTTVPYTPHSPTLVSSAMVISSWLEESLTASLGAERRASPSPFLEVMPGRVEVAIHLCSLRFTFSISFRRVGAKPPSSLFPFRNCLSRGQVSGLFFHRVSRASDEGFSFSARPPCFTSFMSFWTDYSEGLSRGPVRLSGAVLPLPFSLLRLQLSGALASSGF